MYVAAVNRLKAYVATGGTGAISLSSSTAALGCIGPNNNAELYPESGTVIDYVIESGTDWEVGRGQLYTASGYWLSRDIVLSSSASDGASAINVAVGATVYSANNEVTDALGNVAFFGDGSDGDLTITSGTTTLGRSVYYRNLTISGTACLQTNGHYVFISGTLDLSGATSTAIRNSGIAASTYTGGSGAYGGGGGGSGVYNLTSSNYGGLGLMGAMSGSWVRSVSSTNGYGGRGGGGRNFLSSNSYSGGYNQISWDGANVGCADNGSAFSTTAAASSVGGGYAGGGAALSPMFCDYVCGGGGGGGGSQTVSSGSNSGSGGGGGGGGGVLIRAFRVYTGTNSNIVTITSLGGSGGNGSYGSGTYNVAGGGGGGGGEIKLIAGLREGANVITFNTTGGTGGTGVSAGNGSTGGAGSIQYFFAVWRNRNSVTYDRYSISSRNSATATVTGV